MMAAAQVGQLYVFFCGLRKMAVQAEQFILDKIYDLSLHNVFLWVLKNRIGLLKKPLVAVVDVP